MSFVEGSEIYGQWEPVQYYTPEISPASLQFIKQQIIGETPHRPPVVLSDAAHDKTRVETLDILSSQLNITTIYRSPRYLLLFLIVVLVALYLVLEIKKRKTMRRIKNIRRAPEEVLTNLNQTNETTNG